MSSSIGNGEKQGSNREDCVNLLHALWHCQGCRARNRLIRELISEIPDGAAGVFKRDDGKYFIISVTSAPRERWQDPEL